MPTLTIEGLPEPLYRRLREQAEAHHHSLNGEIIVLLGGSDTQSAPVGLRPRHSSKYPE
jgi:plasmid stability protein